MPKNKKENESLEKKSDDIALKAPWDYKNLKEFWDARDEYFTKVSEAMAQSVSNIFKDTEKGWLGLETEIKKEMEELGKQFEYRVYKTGEEETETLYTRTFEMKGFGREDIKTKYDNKTGMLSIMFEKESDEETFKGFSEFQKQEYFDPETILVNQIKATYKDNVLTVVVPKNPDYKAPENIRNIDIDVE